MKENYPKDDYGNEFSIQIKFSDIDMMKVVHHSKYWIWFEDARFKFIKDILDITINDIESSNILIPLIDCSCTYINAIKFDSKVKIITKLEYRKGPYLVFHYRVYDESNFPKLLCKAYTKHVFIDNDFNLKLKIPSFIKKAMDKYFIEKTSAFILISN